MEIKLRVRGHRVMNCFVFHPPLWLKTPLWFSHLKQEPFTFVILSAVYVVGIQNDLYAYMKQLQRGILN